MINFSNRGIGSLKPEAYDEKNKAWCLEDLPILPESFKLEVIRESGKHFAVVEKLMYSGVLYTGGYDDEDEDGEDNSCNEGERLADQALPDIKKGDF